MTAEDAWIAAHEEQTLKQVVRRLRFEGNLLNYQAILDELEEEQPQRFEALRPMTIRALLAILPVYARKSLVHQAYYSYLLARFQVPRRTSSEALTAFLLRQVGENQSLYNQENALRALYCSNRPELVIKALELLDRSGESSINRKVLVDGLLTFQPAETLIEQLWARLDQFSPDMQPALLDYIRFSSGAWGDQMLSLLQSSRDTDIRIACLRYFGRYPSETFRPVLYDLAEESARTQWELNAVCMTVLASYPGGETLQRLKRGLFSRNWYARFNAADSLSRLAVEPEEVRDILEGKDPYAREMLRYRMGLSAELTETR